MEPIALLLLIPFLLGRKSRKSTPGATDGVLNTGKVFNLERYKPGSPEQIELFKAAADHLGVPRSWAESKSLWWLLNKESRGGWVGIPNLEYRSERWGLKDDGLHPDHPDNREIWPAIWSHLRAGGDPPRGRGATGLGQLILTTADRHYPDGRQGIGDPWNEAVGMLSYINARWKSPDRAKECYYKGVCTSGVGIDRYGGAKNWNGY